MCRVHEANNLSEGQYCRPHHELSSIISTRMKDGARELKEELGNRREGKWIKRKETS